MLAGMPVSQRSIKLSDVAQRAGVSPTLVSRILNHDPTLHTREQTRTKVLAAVKELGYVPHASARALRGAHVGAVGLMLHDTASPIFHDVVAGAQEVLGDHGVALLLADVPSDDASTDRFRSLLHAGRIDGMLVQGGHDTNLPLTDGVPTVIVNDSSEEFPSVRLQDEDAANLATQHLVDLGHTNIWYLGGEAGHTTGRRFNGYTSALPQGSTPVSLPGQWNAQAGHDIVVQNFGPQAPDGARPTGLVVGNVIEAIGVLSGLAEIGITVPEDMSIVAIHDAWAAAFLTPPLTVVELPLRQLGRVAAQAALDVIDGKSPGEQVVEEPPPMLVERSSTATPPAGR
jgi:DNA-binding LacI/PurR family transcriptional regulator